MNPEVIIPIAGIVLLVGFARYDTYPEEFLSRVVHRFVTVPVCRLGSAVWRVACVAVTAIWNSGLVRRIRYPAPSWTCDYSRDYKYPGHVTSARREWLKKES